jgi:hypothetical protein
VNVVCRAATGALSLPSTAKDAKGIPKTVGTIRAAQSNNDKNLFFIILTLPFFLFF